MLVRDAILADARRIEEIRVHAWRAAYRHVLPHAELDALPIDETRWIQRITDPPTGWGIFVAEKAGRASGSRASARAATR